MDGQQRKQYLQVFAILFCIIALILLYNDLIGLQPANRNPKYLLFFFIDLSAILSVIFLCNHIAGAWVFAMVAVQAVFLPRVAIYGRIFINLLLNPPHQESFLDISGLNVYEYGIVIALILGFYIALMILLLKVRKAPTNGNSTLP